MVVFICAGLYFNRLDENVILDNYIEKIKRSRQTSCIVGNWRTQPTYNEFTWVKSSHEIVHQLNNTKMIKYWKVYCGNQIVMKGLSRAKYLNVYGVGTSITTLYLGVYVCWLWRYYYRSVAPALIVKVSSSKALPVKSWCCCFVWEYQTCRSNLWRCNRSSRPPRLRRSFSHHCYKGAGWIRIRWKY